MQAVKTEGMGYDTRISPQMEKIDRVFLTPGALMVTGNATDIAVLEQGVLGVQAPNGEVAFTRRGDLKTNVNGVLENGQGHLVLDDGGAPITVPPGFLVNITKEGGVFVRNPTEPGPQVEVPVAQLMLSDASETVLVRREDGLFEQFINDAPTHFVVPAVLGGGLAFIKCWLKLGSHHLFRANFDRCRLRHVALRRSAPRGRQSRDLPECRDLGRGDRRVALPT